MENFMTKRFTGIAGKIVGMLILIRLFMIPSTSSMTIRVILQAVAFTAIGVYAVFFNKFSRKLHVFICICFLILYVFHKALSHG